MGEKNKKVPSCGKSPEQRRSSVRKILAAGSVAAGMGAPLWATPVVKSVVLPAHAQTSETSGRPVVVLRGPIGEPESFGLLDLFLNSAYAAEEDDLAGGCISITIDGSSVTATVTLNTGDSDTKSGILTGCGFTVANVNGYTVVGTVDDENNPTTGDGSVGSQNFNVVINGSCSVISPTTTTTTTTTCGPNGTPCPD